MDVFRQRLDDEYDMVSIITAPTVSYQCRLRSKDKDLKTIDNPIETPPIENIE